MNICKIIADEIKLKIAGTPGMPAGALDNFSLDVPKLRDFGNFSTNIAMILARPMGRTPAAIAEILCEKIREIHGISDVSVMGPGFINIKLSDAFITESASQNLGINSDIPSMIIDLDYGGYNIGKSLHIGHLRTTVVGDAFNRISKYLGHTTRSYNHMGDWGRPMGLIIAWILEYGMPENVDDINDMYPKSTLRAKDDAQWMARAKEITTELQNGNPEYRKMYDIFAPMSLGQVDDILGRLNILAFDENRGERLIAEYIPEMEAILTAKNLLIKSEGAEIIQVKTESDTAPMPPIMWRTGAGTTTYAAADLTAVYYRSKTDKADAIIYFTDNRQNLHFTQIFRGANLAGISDIKLQHIGFGTITGSDGKPFKTRDGNVPSLDKIIDMVNDSVRARAVQSNKNLSDETIKMIGLAALKFNDLMHDVKSDYVFDANAVTSFEGRTGPYILYTAVRLNSIIKKSGNCSENSDIKINTDERNLLLAVLDFSRVVNSAFARRAPDVLANYTFDLCQNINTFYHNCPILRDDVSPELRAHRLKIVKIAQNILTTAIDLMGLKIPSEM